MSDDDDDYDCDDALDEDMSAEDIEAMQLSLHRLKMHYNGGELSHLSEKDVLELLSNAYQRDLRPIPR
jgi:hypothetical protein